MQHLFSMKRALALHGSASMYIIGLFLIVFIKCEVQNCKDTNTEDIIDLRRRIFQENTNFDRSLLGLQPFRVYISSLA